MFEKHLSQKEKNIIVKKFLPQIQSFYLNFLLSLLSVNFWKTILLWAYDMRIWLQIIHLE